jgi:hypothetical protein
MTSKTQFAAALSMVATAMAFAPPKAFVRSSSALNVAVDPTTVTKKEYEDICGVMFGEDEMMQRLQKTSYLYPRHVEVIEDLAPIASDMVDDIVSNNCVSTDRVTSCHARSG